MSTVLSTRHVTSSRFMFRLQMWHISAAELRLLWMLSTTAVLWMRRYMIRQCAFCKVATSPVNRFWRLFWKLHRYRPVSAALFYNCRFPVSCIHQKQKHADKEHINSLVMVLSLHERWRIKRVLTELSAPFLRGYRTFFKIYLCWPRYYVAVCRLKYVVCRKYITNTYMMLVRISCPNLAQIHKIPWKVLAFVVKSRYRYNPGQK